MPALRIFHNPRCSKSRQTLQLLQEKGFEPEIVEYLKTPPNEAEITNILKLLGFDSARQLMRKNEQEFKDMGLSDTSLTESQLVSAMATAPKLIERPIVLTDNKARIGRPPESVLEIL